MIYKRKTIAALIMNLTVIVMETVAIVMDSSRGLSVFKFYTHNSNFLALAACAFAAYYQLLILFGKRDSLPRPVVLFKYAAVCVLSVTFIVVVTVLAPPDGLNGYIDMLFDGSSLFYHFICPTLAFIGFSFFGLTEPLRRRDAVFTLIPTLLYAAITVTLNALGLLDGPYGFLMVDRNPIIETFVWAVIIFGSATLIAFGVRLLHNRFAVIKEAGRKKKNKAGKSAVTAGGDYEKRKEPR